VKEEGRESMAVRVDVSAEEEVSALIRQAAQRFSRVDILVNNAQISALGTVLSVDEEAYIACWESGPLAAFRFMTSRTIATRCLWIGALLAAAAWTILQVLGGIYIGHVFKHSTSTYGFFGIVIALLVWLHLGAQVTLYSAEVNVVVARRLWPRSLLGPPSSRADEKTLRALAKVEERHETEKVDVEFH